MTDPTRQRWSDHELEVFHAEFLKHLADSKPQSEKLAELHDAVYRQEDRNRGRPPGLLQLCSRMSEDLAAMKVASDRQKRFVGGMVFAFTSMGFFLTDTWSRLLDFLRRLLL